MSLNRPQGVPSSAEELDLMKYVETRRKPSRLAPPAEQIFLEFKCPKCSLVEPLPEFGEATICNCGISRQIGAQRVYVWRQHTNMKVVA